MRVLYVDDDRINALLFEEICRLFGGIELQVADDGAQALEVIADWAPQVLVIDLHLPDTSGCELLPQLRQRLAAPTLPAYLCTAEVAEHAAPVAEAAGFTGCWIKPVTVEHLRSHVQTHAAGQSTP